jgi:hypothetical protein
MGFRGLSLREVDNPSATKCNTKFDKFEREVEKFHSYLGSLEQQHASVIELLGECVMESRREGGEALLYLGQSIWEASNFLPACRP